MYGSALTVSERERFEKLEATIHIGLQTFVDVGNALAEIRDSRLYRQQYATFEEYCQERWGLTRRYVNHTIAAAGVVANLGTMVPKPENERQARPLTKLEPEQQVKAWTRAVDTAPNGKVTGAHVKSVVDEILHVAADKGIDVYVWRDGEEAQPEPEPEPERFYSTVWPPATRAARPEPEPEPEFEPEPNHRLINQSNSNEWYTPAAYVDAARTVMGAIDLDPASNEFANRVVLAAAIYTEADDGLERPWFGRLWLNPPYGLRDGQSNQALWSERLVDEYAQGNVTEAVLLVNAVPGNRWFKPLWDFPICFPDHRIRFYNEDTEAGQPTHSNALVYMGPNRQRFAEVFSQFGAVVVRYEP